MQKETLFFGLDSIVKSYGSRSGIQWFVNYALLRSLRDYQDAGYQLVGVINPGAYGLCLDGESEESTLVSYFRGLLMSCGLSCASFVVEPDLSQCHRVKAYMSTWGIMGQGAQVLGDGEKYGELQRICGIHERYRSGNFERVSRLSLGLGARIRRSLRQALSVALDI